MGSVLTEGQSTNRPPLFDGTNYTYWKARMKIFIQALDYDLWSIIVNGPHTPTIKSDGIDIPKPETEWDVHDKKMAQLNAKAMNVLYCSLDANEFNRISTCISAKEIWNRLEVTHEGTNQVKESRINMLVHEYELFKMKAYESIGDMFTRFTNIINGLKSLDKSYTNGDLVRKVLRSLPRSWEAKVTAIQEAKDLNTLSLEELVGSLMTHELQQQQHFDEEQSKNKRMLGLKSVVLNDENESTSSESDEKNDLALITRKFQKFMRKKFEEKKRTLMKGEPSNEKEYEVICYECNKPGHYKPDCPYLKKGLKKFKKKAMIASWSDSDVSSFEEEEKNEEENLCLMANNEEVNPNSLHDFTFDELYGAFYELIDDFANLSSKNKDLKNQVQNLTLEKDKLLEGNEVLLQENMNLKNEVERLKPIVDKFTLSSTKLNMILENQRAVFNKAGLGYNPLKRQKFLKNIYVHANNSTEVTCFKCGKPGHKAYICHTHNVKKIWVPKGTILANPKGPKKAWVPRSKA